MSNRSRSHLARYRHLRALQSQWTRLEPEARWIHNWLDRGIEREINKWERRNLDPKFLGHARTVKPSSRPGRRPGEPHGDSALPSVVSETPTRGVELFSLDKATEANGSRLTPSDLEFARNGAREFGSSFLYQILADTRSRLPAEEQAKQVLGLRTSKSSKDLGI